MDTLKRGSAIVLALTCLTVLVAFGGGQDNTYDDGIGFRDGFVSGYGKECVLHSPQIQARWHDVAYTRAYADGLAIGTKACDSERSAVSGIESVDQSTTAIASR